MTSIPSSYQGVDYAYRYQQKENMQLSAVSQNAEGEKRIQVSASSSTTVTISGSQQQLTYGVGEVDKPQPAPKSVAADKILGFIELRLGNDLADGATAEELASRLQAGYEGFVSGYKEAYDELSEAGLLSPDIEDTISQTYDDVIQGIQALAEQYGVASPVEASPKVEQAQSSDIGEITSAPVAFDSTPVKTPQSVFSDLAQDIASSGKNLSALLESSTLDYESLAKRDFSFSLKTQDGDTVTITASASRFERAEASSVRYDSPYGSFDSGRLAVESSESNSFSFSVDGELDEEELVAINDLLTQVGDLSERFFTGNIEEAFEMALNIGFDESEIARFSLNLKQEVTTKIETTYAQYTPDASLPDTRLDLRQQLDFANGDNSISRLIDFIKLLDDTLEKADRIGLERDSLPSLAQNVSNALGQSEPAQQTLAPFLENIIRR